MNEISHIFKADENAKQNAEATQMSIEFRMLASAYYSIERVERSLRHKFQSKQIEESMRSRNDSNR